MMAALGGVKHDASNSLSDPGVVNVCKGEEWVQWASLHIVQHAVVFHMQSVFRVWWSRVKLHSDGDYWFEDIAWDLLNFFRCLWKWCWFPSICGTLLCWLLFPEWAVAWVGRASFSSRWSSPQLALCSAPSCFLLSFLVQRSLLNLKI